MDYRGGDAAPWSSWRRGSLSVWCSIEMLLRLCWIVWMQRVRC